MAITTNREYIQATLGRFNLTSTDIDMIFAENPTLMANDNTDLRSCKMAVYNSLSSILPVANVSEADYSVTWNMDSLKMWYNVLCKELGKPNALKPAIRDRSNRW